MADVITKTTIGTSTQPEGEFVLHIPDVGALSGAIVSAVIVFGYVISKFKKDTTVNSTEVLLYKNLSDRIEVISKTLIRVESEREALLKSVTRSEARIAELEKHEEENKVLRVRLDEKDRIIKSLQEGSEIKQLEIVDLQNRIHDLEMQMKQRFIDCQVCDHKKVSMSLDARTRGTDETLIIPIGDE